MTFKVSSGLRLANRSKHRTDCITERNECLLISIQNIKVIIMSFSLPTSFFFCHPSATIILWFLATEQKHNVWHFFSQCSHSVSTAFRFPSLKLLQAVSECILVDLLTLWTLPEEGTSDWLFGKLVPQKGCPEVGGRKGRKCSLFSSFACISLQDTHLSTPGALYSCFSHLPLSFRHFLRAFIFHCCRMYLLAATH